MSVLEKLRTFRYIVADGSAASGSQPRELPWRAVRAVNVATLKTEEPDLHLMKTLLSTLASFTVTSTTVSSATDTDLLQLLLLMQASLQFALHSQSVLKSELVERQNTEAVQQVTAKYIERMDAKLAVLNEDNRGLREERDTLKLSVDSLNRLLAQQQATASTLERQLEREREQFYTTVTRREKLLSLHGRPADTNAASLQLPLSHFTQVVGGESRCPTCGRSRDDLEARERANEAVRRRKRRTRRTSTRYEADESTVASTSVTSATSEAAPSTTDPEVRQLRARRGIAVGSRHEAGDMATSSHKGASAFVDWKTFTQLMGSLQETIQQQQQQSLVGAAHAERANTGVVPYGSERSAPTDVPRDSEAAAVPPNSASLSRSLPMHTPAEELLATVVAAVQTLKDDMREQMSTVVVKMDTTADQLAADLTRLRESHERLAATVAQQQGQASAATAAQAQNPARASPTVSKAFTPRLSAPPKPPTSQESPVLVRTPRGSATKGGKQQATSAAHSTAELDTPAEPPIPRQESVTPLATSLPATPLRDTIAATAAPPSAPPSALFEATAFVSTSDRSNKVSVVAPLASQSSPLSLSGGSLLASAPPSALAAPPATAVRTLDKVVGPSDGQESGIGSPRPAPSLQSSALSNRSRTSLPDFDVASALRSPLKSGDSKKTPKEGSSPSGNVVPSAKAQETGPQSSSSRSLRASQPCSDPLHEERPANVASMATEALASAQSDTSSLPFLPRSAIGASLVGDIGSRDASRTEATGEAEEAIKRCQHCHQKTPLSTLRAHEAECDMRLIPCATCGRRIVARLMPKHQCKLDSRLEESGLNGSTAPAPADRSVTKGPDEPDGKPLDRFDNFIASATGFGVVAGRGGVDSLEHSRACSQVGSLGPKRESSLLLQEAQQELRSLMEEEEAYQRSVRKRACV